jgi:hypothetical protein
MVVSASALDLHAAGETHWLPLPKSTGSNASGRDKATRIPLRAFRARLLSLGTTITQPTITYQEQRRIGNALSDLIDLALSEVDAFGISIPNRQNIEAYLREHIDMVSLTSFVLGLVASEFVDDASISLEYYVSPEDGDEQLVFYVRLRELDQTSYQRLSSIWDAYANFISGLSGWLHVTIDYGKR